MIVLRPRGSRAVTTAKLFVLDTNVALHDANCVQPFEENDVVIALPVLEELDKF